MSVSQYIGEKAMGDSTWSIRWALKEEGWKQNSSQMVHSSLNTGKAFFQRFIDVGRARWIQFAKQRKADGGSGHHV